MRRLAAALVTLAIGAIAAAPAAAQPAQPAPSSSLTPPANAPPPRPIPLGRSKAIVIESPANLPTHTVYRPQAPTGFGGAQKLPIVAWGNGACSNAGLLFSTFLTQVASHGYLVIASGPKDAPLPSFARPRTADQPKPTGAAPTGRTRDEDLLKAIDWAIAENSRRGGPLYNLVATDKVAVMGQSCGGLQATAVAHDPRIDTVVIWNSGVFNAPRTAPNGQPVAALSGATKDSLKRFHAPVAYFLGGPSDLAYANGKDDFSRLTGVPAFLGSINSGHGGTFDHPGGGRFGEVGVKWLDWRLNGDPAAAKWFAGPDCVLCKDPIWEVARKGM